MARERANTIAAVSNGTIILGMLGGLHFDQPWWLAAVAAGVVPILIAARARRRGRGIGWASVVAQCLAVATAAVALAQPLAPVGPRGSRPYLVFHDVSASIRGQAAKAIQWPGDLPREDFGFAENVAPLAGPAQTQSAAAAENAQRWKYSTNLAPPLRLAAQRACPPGAGGIAGVVLLSDGQWQDDWIAAAAAIGQAGVRLAIVPLDSPPADARIAAIACQRQPDKSVAIRVTAAANAAFVRRLTVRRDGLGKPLFAGSVELMPDAPYWVVLADSPPADRLATYRAALDRADEFPENDVLTGAVLPVSQRCAIVASAEVPGLRDRLAARLGAAESIAPQAAPEKADAWMPYSAVVLVDPAGRLLSPAARAAVAQYVRDGGGLVLLGCGPNSSPSDRDDPLNAVAALVANPFQRKPLRLVVVLDSSGSMSERTGAGGEGPRKFDLARQAVLSLQRHLTAKDSLAVIRYADTPQLVYDSKQARPDFTALGDALAAITPAGQTKVMPALMMAANTPPPDGYEGLVLLVSDLLTEKYEPEHAGEIDAAEKLFKANRYGLSIVATKGPDDANEGKTLLDELARRINAQLVRREGLAGLAEVFERFVRQARGEGVARGSFTVAFQGGLPGLSSPRLPPVEAYIFAAAQDDARTVAAVGSDPILGLRQVGLGRSATLALPFTMRDNAALAASPQLLDLIAAIGAWAERQADDPRFTGHVRRAPGRIEITVDARDDKGPMNSLVLKAIAQGVSTMTPASAPAEEATMEQVAPGSYRVRMGGASVAAGPMSLAVRDEQGRVVWRQALADSYPPEFAAIGANWDNLRRLAELSGGRIIRRQDVADLGSNLVREGLTPLWPYFLVAALTLMLIDWCGTRILRKG